MVVGKPDLKGGQAVLGWQLLPRPQPTPLKNSYLLKVSQLQRTNSENEKKNKK